MIWIYRVSAVTWTRQWSPYSRHFILRSGEPQVPGVVSVNSPAYDWGWIAGGTKTVKEGQNLRVERLRRRCHRNDPVLLFHLLAETRPDHVHECTRRRNALPV